MYFDDNPFYPSACLMLQKLKNKSQLILKFQAKP